MADTLVPYITILDDFKAALAQFTVTELAPFPPIVR
jgi:hypothetical protein